MKTLSKIFSGLTTSRINRVSAKTILQHNAIIISFILLFIILSFSTNVFLKTRNLLNILDQSSQVGIIACGMTIVMISGGFDLSVGATFAFTGVISAVIANQVNSPVGFLAGTSLGFVIGLINGIVISKIRINSFIATLASNLVILGLGLISVHGRIVLVDAPFFNILGRGEFLGAKFSVYIFMAIIVLTWFILSGTTLGRHIYAVGGNAEAARLSGVSVDAIRIISFGICGLCAGISGVIAASRISTGLMDVGATLPLESIAGVVIGGTSIMGGEGAIWRTIFGVLLLRLIINGFNILAVDAYYQQIFQGLIILVAVAIDTLSKRQP